MLDASVHLPQAPVVLPTARLAEVLAILVVELTGLLANTDCNNALERITNRIDALGRIAGASHTSLMLSAIGNALMQLET